jgi:hypothetical protein
VSAQPVLDLADLNAGDVILYGDDIVTGMAFGPGATDGAGISEVDLFLGDRGAGGVYLGCAHPGVDAMPNLTLGARLVRSGFQATITLPNNASGGRASFAYTTSLTGQETVVSVPLYPGTVPAPTPRPSTS